MKKFKGQKLTRHKNLRATRRLITLALISLLAYFLIVSCNIPIRVTISQLQNIPPQAIFVLGGDFSRTVQATELWRKNPDMDVWVSDFPQFLDAHKKKFITMGGDINKFKFDGRATDTVTNFTTMVNEFELNGIKNIYLVTSKSHMPRSEAVAYIILGSRGILTTPINVETMEMGKIDWYQKETIERKYRDVARSFLWLYFGKTGASFNPRL